MRPSETEAVFRQRLGPPNEERKASIETLLNGGMSFFRECRVANVTENYGDMLLFQFGIYDWGSGPFFEIDLTRQFAEVEADSEDSSLSQLHVTRFYSPSPDLEALGAGERWCRNRAELPEFSAWIMAHPALATVTNLSSAKTEIRWELV